MALSYHIKQIIAFENTSMPLLLIFSFVQAMPLTTSGYLHSVFDYAVVLCVFDYAVVTCVQDYYKVGLCILNSQPWFFKYIPLLCFPQALFLATGQ